MSNFSNLKLKCCKIEFRHILFKKISKKIFLNNLLTTCQTISYNLKKKEKFIFSFPRMPKINFAKVLLKFKIRHLKWIKN